MTNDTLIRLCARACVLVCCLLPAAPALAQPVVSTLSGRVTDPQGDPVPGASVTVTSATTAAAFGATTGTDGRFLLTMLPPGTYAADVRIDGFRPWRSPAVAVQVGQERHLDVQLTLGTLAEAVTVQAEGLRMSASVDGVMSASHIETLPLNGRNFLELALLVPGNQPTPTFDPTKSNSVLVSSAGQLGRGGTVTIDGQDNNDDVVGGPLVNLPIDAVQEFQIATSRFGADLGRSGSSSINVVTRSGANQSHGTAAFFARDARWQARPATLDADATEPPFDRQQLSGALGGALRRDRLFWFGAAELRNQDGAVLVGSRDTSARTIRRTFAPAPLDDGLWSMRVDGTGTTNRVTLRYAGERSTDTSASAVERALGSATQRQRAENRYHSVLGSWTAAPSSSFVNALHVSISTFENNTSPVATAPQLTFPSLQDGASFRMPQDTRQRRIQVANTATAIRGAHALRFGGQLQRVDGEFGLGVFRQGRIELVEDFPAFDRNGDGRTDDNDLLFAVTLRSGKPNQDLVLPDSDNTHLAAFVQDDWRLSPTLQLNLGVRYEVDTDVNNQSRVAELNPIVQPFVQGTRRRDMNNVGPRAGFAWTPSSRTTVHGGYGTYFDRVVLQIQSLERGLDGRALPVEVRAGNSFFVDPATGRLPPFAPTVASPFGGFILPGAGASGINVIDSRLQNPTVHEFNVGVEQQALGLRTRVDVVHTAGTNFLIGRTVGEVFNPVVGGPDRVVNIESSARTQYDALLVTSERTFTSSAAVRIAYTLARAMNYANDDQIPFLNGPIDPNDLRREWGPTPNDRRHRLVLSGRARVAGGVNLSGIWTLSSGVPMDIMMPDGRTRIPTVQRNAGGRQFESAAELNSYITSLNASGGVNGVLLPLVDPSARFSDRFNSLDLRVSRPFSAGGRVRVEPMVEVFNLFDVANILGSTNVNYSGFTNVLVRDSDDPQSPGYLSASRFGRPVTTAGGLFGSGGPRALQFAARVTF
jgi:hypothetical protein